MTYFRFFRVCIIETMRNTKKFIEGALRIIFVLILWIVGFFALSFFGLVTLELGSTYSQIATNLLGCSLIILLSLYTYKEYKRLRDGI